MSKVDDTDDVDISCSVGPKEVGGAGLEVLVQGSHTKAAMDLLMAEGVPKKWIETTDATSKKKK